MKRPQSLQDLIQEMKDQNKWLVISGVIVIVGGAMIMYHADNLTERVLASVNLFTGGFLIGHWSSRMTYVETIDEIVKIVILSSARQSHEKSD